MIRLWMKLSALCLLILSYSFAGQWYPIQIHRHTTMSDGGETPVQAAATTRAKLGPLRSDGKCGMIVTDHFDGVARNFGSYIPEIKATCVPGQFVAIPGLELGSKWHPEANTVSSSHLLALGRLPDNFSRLVSCYEQKISDIGLPLTEKFDVQQLLINEVLALGMLPVAAHPSQMLFGGNIIRSDNRFNMKSGYSGLRGVGVFNTLGPGQDEEVVQFYLRLVASGQSMIVISDSDSHRTTTSAIPELALDSLSRITWVYADDLTEEEILRGIASGQTYAAQLGANFRRFRSIGGQNPEAKTIGVDVPIIQASAIVKADNVELIIYRNGQEVARQKKNSNPSRQAMHSLTRPEAEGITSQSRGDGYLGWIDSDRQETVRSYVIRVMGTVGGVRRTLLITSPIYLKPRPAGLTRQFFDAVKSGNTASAIRMLSTDPSLANERDLRPVPESEAGKYHSSQPLALSIAIALGRNDIVKLLLQNGASPDDYLGVGEPGPLMVAAYAGNKEACQLLIQYGGDVNICTDGNTPLVWAIDGRHSELAKWLIEHGADINHPGDSDLTPLVLARKANLPEIVNLLRAKGAKE